MADVVSDGGSKEANEKVPKKGLMTGNTKWYVIAGLGGVAVLVFFFVSKSNSSAQTSANTGSSTGTLDPTTAAALQSALMGLSNGSGMAGPIGAQGPAGPTGATGKQGPIGRTGKTGKTGPIGRTGKTGRTGPRGKEWEDIASTGIGGSYTVKAGDTLSSIAPQLGSSYSSLYNANRHTIGGNPDMLHPGMRLRVP